MIDIPLAALPNQTLSIQIEQQQYDITVTEANGVMAISIDRDGVTIVSATRLLSGTPVLPYEYQESGNFAMLTGADEIPYYPAFGITQNLVYLSEAELLAIRGG